VSLIASDTRSDVGSACIGSFGSFANGMEWLWTVGGFNHLEKYERQLGRIIPYIMETYGK